MINLKINYSVEREALRVQDAVNRIDWFKKNGYKVRFPKGLSLEHPDIQNLEYIKKTILEEYNEDDYKKEEEYILEKLPIINTVLLLTTAA